MVLLPVAIWPKIKYTNRQKRLPKRGLDMQRLIAVVLASLLGFTAPVLAQTAGNPPGQNPDRVLNGTAQTDDGLNAQAQAPGLDTTTLLIGGGLAIGAGVLIAVVVNQNRDDNPPVSP